MVEEYEKTKLICVRLNVGLIKMIDEEVIRVNEIYQDEDMKTDRSKIIRKALKERVYTDE